MHRQRAFSGFLAAVILSLLACATGRATAQENAKDSGQAHPKGMRFNVVHVHFGNNCAGYLYVNQESVRYKALVPENYKSHSFEIQRAEITALQPWVLMGQAQNITEIKTAKATYHFWLLPKDADLNTARGSNLNGVAVPAGALIAAIRDPEAVLKQGAEQDPAPDAGSGSAPAGGSSDAGADGASSGTRETTSQRRPAPAGRDSSSDSDTQAARKLPAGALEGVYVGLSLEYSHMGHREYYFTADGWVINSIPYVNMDNFDMTSYRNDPSHQLFFGRYRVEGNKINILWANNARDVIKYSETAAEPGIDTYIPTCRCTGKKISGKYHWTSPTDERYIQFFPDGTFFDHGLTDQVVGNSPHGYADLTDPPRNFRGTYSVRNQRLTFDFSDGKHSTVAFIVPKALENASKFEWMGVGYDSGVKGAENVNVLVLYEEHYQVQP